MSHHLYVKQISNLEKEMKTLFGLVHRYYEEYDADHITIDELKHYYDMMFPRATDANLYQDLISAAFNKEVNETMCKNLLDRLLEKHYAAEMMDKILPVIEGERSCQLHELSPIIEEYKSLLLNPPEEMTVPEPFEMDLDELVQQEIVDGGYDWPLQDLTNAIGGVRRKTNGLIYAYVDCYDDKTEVLTRTGWKPFCKLEYGERIAQYNTDKTITFVEPIEYYKKKYIGKMCWFHDTIGRYEQMVTPTHRIIYRRNNILKEQLARDVKPNQTQKYDRCGYAPGNARLSWYERFLIAYQANGTQWRKECDGSKCGHFTIRFSFSKQRKIKRFQTIINNLGFKYKIKIREFKNPKWNKQLTFYVQIPEQISKTFNWIDLTRISSEWGKEFIKELSLWDGTKQKNYNIIDYSSRIKYNVDIVQAICTLSGFVSKYHVSKGRLPHHSDIHRLTIREFEQASGTSIIKEYVDYNGYVYCVKVPSSYLVVRRNNKPCISGNSGKTSFALASATHFASQMSDDDIIAYCGNEEAAPRLYLRAVQAFTGLTRTEIVQDPNKAEKMAIKKGLRKLRFFEDIINGEQLEFILQEHKPTIIFIDQATNVDVNVGRKVEGVGYLEALFRWYRRIANRYNVGVVGVSQGAGDAGKKKKLELEDIYGSRVAIQASLDYAIGIGRTDQAGYEDVRYFNVPKNKLKDGDPVYFSANFYRQRCRYERL